MKIKFYLPLMISIILALSLVSASTMTRTAPSTATPNGQFQITYTTSSSNSMWGASIEESVTGGCTFPSGLTSYKTVMLSEDGLTKSVTITAPGSGSCTFTGDYKFGTDAIITFPSVTTTISGICTPSCSGKVCGDNGCGGSCGTCTSGTTCSNGQCIPGICTPDNSCAANTCIGSTCTNNCGTVISGTKTGCVAPTCNEFFSKTMNWYAFTDNDCNNGYIITGILGLVGLLVFFKLSK